MYLQNVYKPPLLDKQRAALLGESISAEAAAVLARMEGLSPAHEAAYITYIDDEVEAGNWNFDEFYLFKSNDTDWLKGWKSKTATNNGATRVADGAYLDGGLEYILTNFDPSIDGVNYKLNDACAEALVKTFTNFNREVFQTPDELLKFDINISQFTKAQVNSTNKLTAPFSEDTLVALVREDSGNQKVYVDGGLVATEPDASTGIATGNIKIGGGMTGIITSLLIGPGIGFDHEAHHTNLRALITALASIGIGWMTIASTFIIG